ncbi:MAG TPA: PEP-CTERM sorting domain-containing protein [Caulobacteraceae bacterium]|nr:PEP-CTERM sorting domain-containing protein [Caulobacteraceae bacterium]
MKVTCHLIGAALAIAALAASSGAALAGSATLSVPGTANPFLSGMPAGSSCCIGDSAPGESPVFAGAVSGGETLSFTGLSGGVSYSGGTPTDGPAGNAGLLVDTLGYEGVSTINNIAGFTNAPVDALVGVFLSGSMPTSNPAGSVLDFTSPTLTPGLQQVFYIGDGTLGSITVPTGATRLFLGTVDGFGWYNNTGAIDVTVNGVTSVPEPAAWALLLTGVVGLGAALRLTRSRRGLSPAPL